MFKLTIISLIFTLFVLTGCQSLSPKSTDGVLRESDVGSEVKQKYTYALRLMSLGKDDAAVQLFDQITELNDRLSGPYANRGLIYLKQGHAEKAEQSFQDAISRNANNVTALNQLGMIMRERKDFTAARTHYETALAADDQHANAHLNLGILCDIYLQDKPCALAHYQAYQAINKDEEVGNWIIDLKEQL